MKELARRPGRPSLREVVVDVPAGVLDVEVQSGQAVAAGAEERSKLSR
jgi:hypothetical protein